MRTEQDQPRNILDSPDRKASEQEWWDKHPSLIINQRLHQIGDNPPDPASEPYQNAYNQISSEISGNFSQTFFDKPNNPSDVRHVVVLNPVYVDLNQQMFQQIQSENGEDFMNACQEELPESLRPMAVLEGKRLTGKNLHPNFINLVFVDGKQFPINRLTYGQQIAFFQTQMAKLGAFKNLFISVDSENSESPIMSATMATLEGGHPTFFPDSSTNNFRELARRLKVFGSAEVAGKKIEQATEKLTKEVWENLDSVRFIQELGNFAGEYDLLSKPVKLENLVRNPILKRMIPRIADYSQQAEGAIYYFDPTANMAVVTATGRFGSVKTDLKTDDLVPIEFGEEKLSRWGVEGLKIKEQSVEAQEFLLPQIQLAKDFDIRIVQDGQVYHYDSTGQKMPPIRAIFHMHRGVDINNNNIPILIPDVTINPPVGCGVDLMEEISKKMMTQALYCWEKSNRTLPYIITDVPNHGLNVMFFWTEDNQGKIHNNPFDVFMGDVESGDLRFKHEIVQV